MANWTQPRRLINVADYYDELSGHYGVYELGFKRGDFFIPKYVGRARAGSSCLYGRLSSYINEGRCHNIHLRGKIGMERHSVYFHISCVGNPAFTEAYLLYTHEIGRHGGLYEWNRRYEYAALREAGYSFHGEDGR